VTGKEKLVVQCDRPNCWYQRPRKLVGIGADLDMVSAEIMALLREVHS